MGWPSPSASRSEKKFSDRIVLKKKKKKGKQTSSYLLSRQGGGVWGSRRLVASSSLHPESAGLLEMRLLTTYYTSRVGRASGQVSDDMPFLPAQISQVPLAWQPTYLVSFVPEILHVA